MGHRRRSFVQSQASTLCHAAGRFRHATRAASPVIRRIWQSGATAFDYPQGKVDTTVAYEVLQEPRRTPLASSAQLAPCVNARLGRNDLNMVHIEDALAQISCMPVLRRLRSGPGRGRPGRRMTGRRRFDATWGESATLITILPSSVWNFLDTIEAFGYSAALG
jgi:hypothetical protein